MMTSTQFIAAVEDRISLPVNQTRFGEAAVMRFGDSVILTKILPMILRVRQSYLEAVASIAITGAKSYAVPYRATGRGVVSVTYWRGEDDEYKLIKIDGSQAHEFSALTGEPTHWYFQGERLFVSPVPDNTASQLRVRHDRKPSMLTDVANCTPITAINTATGVLTCTAVPTAVILASVPCDLIMGRPGNAVNAMDISPTNVSATSITFAVANLPIELIVGDYVALAGYSPFLQIPEELCELAVLGACLRILPSIGDLELSRAMQDDYNKEERAMSVLYQPRAPGHPQYIVRRNSLVAGRRGRKHFYTQDPNA